MSGATTATYLAGASLAATVAGSVAQGYATSAADKANASIAGNNAAVAQQNAKFAGEEGEVNAGQSGQKTRQEEGSLRANMGASGVDVNTGSSANVQASQAQLGQLDMMNIRSNAARQAYGFDTQSTSFENQASIDKSSASNAVTSGYIGGVTKAAGEATMLSDQGAFSGWDSHINNSALNDVGPFDNSTPWRNQPLGS